MHHIEFRGLSPVLSCASTYCYNVIGIKTALPLFASVSSTSGIKKFADKYSFDNNIRCTWLLVGFIERNL